MLLPDDKALLVEDKIALAEVPGFIEIVKDKIIEPLVADTKEISLAATFTSDANPAIKAPNYCSKSAVVKVELLEDPDIVAVALI